VVEKPLAGQAALVTGGGGGIGSASAAWLARDGAAVLIMGRTESTLVDARREILDVAGADAVVEPFVGDALDQSQVRDAFRTAAALADRLAIAVSVVGGGTMKPLLMFEPDEVLQDLNRNIVSAFLVIRHATPLMTAGGGGSIVCISSDAAKIPWPFLALYNTSKAGVEGMVRGAALELALLLQPTKLNDHLMAVRRRLAQSYEDPSFAPDVTDAHERALLAQEVERLMSGLQHYLGLGGTDQPEEG